MKENFQNSQTIVNLCRAFLMESQYAARCKFMSEKAQEEKYCYLEEMLKKEHDRGLSQAKVFYEAIEQNMTDLGIEVESEDVFAFRKASLAENFIYTADEATICRDEIYPEYIETAKEEGFKELAEKFELMLQIKDCLAKTMEEIGTKLTNKNLYKSQTPKKFKCDNCGHEETLKEAWSKCPFCDYEQGHVIVEVESDKEN